MQLTEIYARSPLVAIESDQVSGPRCVAFDVLDDMVGMLLYVVGEMAVTRKLDTEFFAPVLLGTRYEVSADLVSRTGRKLKVRAELREATTGQRVASAVGLFIVVTLEHFTSTLGKSSPNHVAETAFPQQVSDHDDTPTATNLPRRAPGGDL